MFAYCLNNPVNGCDPCGTCFHRWDFWNDCEKCGGRTIGDRWNSIVCWCNDAVSFVTNDDVAVAQSNLKSSKFSFYKGAMVFSTSLPVDRSAFSFGIVVLDDYFESSPYAVFDNTLNHEYGHFRHLQQTGFGAYTLTTAIPSVASAAVADNGEVGFPKWMSDNYYNLPWERIADQLGGVNRGYTPGANALGPLYWLYTLSVGVFI